MAKDYYSILGVEKTATKDELKKAFYKLAHQYHPDKKGGDAEKFKEINEAYQVLGDEEKRKQYDQFGTTFDGASGAGFNWQDFAQGGGFNAGGFNINFDNVNFGFEDVFSSMFGGGFGPEQQSKRNRKGRDLEIELDIDFSEAAFGVDRDISLNRLSECSKCHGTGAEPGSTMHTCDHCGGKGRTEHVRNTILGGMRTVSECHTCHGTGKLYDKKCNECDGKGTEKKKSTIKISVPAGIDNGETLRLSGQGEAGAHGAPAGDLYVHIRVNPDKHFKRDGYDVVSEELIHFSIAVLGGKKEIQTLDGKVDLKIPAGTASGQVFVLKGKGIHHLRRGGRGNHLVRVVIETPQKLSKEQKVLMEKLKEEGL